MSGVRVRPDAAFHSFDAEVATKVGINAAVVYRNLVFWVRHNETNRRNFHEGRYWTYNSLAAFDEQFPYLTAKQIRTALDKLVESGLILKGNFAEDRFKRANWYALGEPICPNGQMELPDTADDTFAPKGSASAPEGKCIENRSKPDSKPYPQSAGSAEVTEADVDAIWNAYPADRRRDRKVSSEHIAEALRQVSLDELLAATEAYAAESANFTRSKVAFIDNWLRVGKWRRHVDDLRITSSEKQADAAKQLAHFADWIKTRHGMCQYLTTAQVREILARGLVSADEAAQAGFGQGSRHV